MNKLKLLYDVARTMKNLEKIDGVLQVNVRRDQDEVFSLRKKFEIDEAMRNRIEEAPGPDLDGGHGMRGRDAEFGFPGHWGPGHAMAHRMFHRHHDARGGRGIKGAFTRLSFLFGILGSLKIEEKENGTAVVSLNLSEIPEDLSAMLLEKIQSGNGHFQHRGFLRKLRQVEKLDGILVMTVTKDRAVEAITINVDSTGLDEKSGRHTMAAFAEVQFA